MDSDSICSDTSIYDEEDDDYMSEEDLVFFLQDSDDDDEEVVMPPPAPRPKSPIRQLSPSLIAQMEAANVGRLRWLEAGRTELHAVQLSEEDAALFPPLGDSSNTDETRQSYGRWPKKRTPVRMRVDFVKDGPYEIKFRTNRPTIHCNFVSTGKQCPYGDKCKFSHDVPMCNAMKNGNLCMRGSACRFMHPAICHCKDKECNLFHPKKEDLGRLRGMKTRMCKNIIKTDQKGKTLLTGTCPSGDACKFAHTLQQIKEAVETCRQKDKCRLVKLVSRTDPKKVKRMVYKNVPDGQVCWRIHPEEAITNFVARTCVRPKTDKPQRKQEQQQTQGATKSNRPA